MFKKPNILRRRVKPNLLNTNPKPCVEQIHIVYTTAEETPSIVKSTPASKHKCNKANHKSRIPAQRIMLDSYMCNEYRKRKMQNCNLAKDTSKPPSYKSDVIMMGPEDCPRVQMKRVESGVSSFPWQSSGKSPTLCYKTITETTSCARDSVTADINTTVLLTNLVVTLPSNTRTCSKLTISDTDSTIVPPLCQREKSDTIIGDSVVVMENVENPEQQVPAEWACTHIPCTHIFNSYNSLSEHLLSHNTEQSLQDSQQDITDDAIQDSSSIGSECSYSCPARLSTKEKRCPRVFCERKQLHTHIREEHTLFDAPFKCEICARGFFWRKGLRAHHRTHAGVSGTSGPPSPRVFACSWPACARVFTQACRLREHSRAHTGDKPYSCTFPKCSWSFRTASKLQRHARGHTGERRHACQECGRGFLRAEHLREHVPRHAPARPPQHSCPHPGCEQKFSNKSSLYGHQKRHAAEQAHANIQTSQEAQIVSPSFMVHIGDILASTSINTESDEDYHAARTHCPWPLRSEETVGVGESGGEPPTHVRIPQLSENSESMDGVENNEFAVQKDLFLHEHPMQLNSSRTISCEESSSMEQYGMSGAGSASGTQLEHHLGLLDSPCDLHITHLLQEELLYNDVSTDETSFQVLLLSDTLSI